MKAMLTVFMLCSILSPVFADQAPLTLGGHAFEGKIYAKGIYSLFGLIKVKGILSFNDSLLYWSTEGSLDSIPYEWRKIDDHLMFTASAVIENDETIEWRGFYDGDKVEDVHAVWTRKAGDAIHDFFLPDVVTMIFKPSRE